LWWFVIAVSAILVVGGGFDCCIDGGTVGAFCLFVVFVV
jgi:hypothetical protein